MNKYTLISITGIVICLIFAAFAPKANATTYYVAAAGSNTNTGTSTSQAWQTVSKVNSTTLYPGDTVLFNRGDTFSGTGLGAISTSGTAGNPITYGAYGTGANPKIFVVGRGMDIEASYLNISGIDVTASSSDAYWFWGTLTNDSITNTTVGASTTEAFVFYNGTYTNFLIGNATSTASADGVDMDGSAFVNLTIATSSFTGSTVGFNMYNNGSASNIQVINSAFNGDGTGVYSGNGISGFNIVNSQIENNTNGGTGGLFFSTPTANTTNNVNLINDMITGNAGNGITTLTGITNFTIASTSVSNNGTSGYLQGMYIASNITNLVVSSSTFSGNTGSGLDIGGNSTVAITSSTFNHNAYNPTVVGEGVIAEGSSVVTINNSSASYNGDDGMDAGASANFTINNCSSTNNGYPGVGSGAGNGYSWHETSTGLIENSYAGNNLINAVAHVGSASVNMHNDVFYSNISEVLPLIWLQGTNYVFQNNTLITGPNYWIPGSNPPQLVEVLSGTTVSMTNNVLYAATTTNTDVGILNGGTLSEDYNLLYGPLGMTYSGITPGAHDLSTTTNPLFNNVSGGGWSLNGGDLSLSSLSPLIDMGTSTIYTTSTTTDYLGHPLYGTADIGAYEYQPPFAMGISLVDPTGNIRIYGDGAFRYTSATSSAMSASFSVAPPGGAWSYSASSTRPQWLDISNFTWNMSGTYAKAWTASSSSATTTVYTIGNLLPNVSYDFAVDGAATTSIQSSGSGQAVYTYAGSGGYSKHTFTVTKTATPSTGNSVSSAAAIPVTEVSYSSAGGSISSSALASLLTPGPATTAYLASLNRTTLAGCPSGLTCTLASAASPTTHPAQVSNPVFTRNLKVGSSGSDVKALQIFLDSQGYVIAATGPGSPGNETSTFGSLTKAALMKFQRAHDLPVTGFFGPLTRAAIQQMT